MSRLARSLGEGCRLLAAMLLVLVMAGPGCGKGAADDPRARAFRDQSLSILRELRDELRPDILGSDQAALDRKLARRYEQAAQEGHPLPYGAAVLDARGRLLAGRYAADQAHPQGRSVPPGQNYSNYGHFEAVLEGGEGGSCLLYIPEGTLYTICLPVKEKRRVRGAVCLGYRQDYVKRAGLTEKEFLALEFPDK